MTLGPLLQISNAGSVVDCAFEGCSRGFMGALDTVWAVRLLDAPRVTWEFWELGDVKV